MRVEQLLDLMSSIHDDHWSLMMRAPHGTQAKVERKLFERLVAARVSFDSVSGVGKTTPIYRRAAEYYDESMIALLEKHPEWRREINARYVLYGHY